MKNILVPVDFSETSESAADYAVEMAKITHAKLIFYCVFAMPVLVVDTPAIVISAEDIEKENKKMLEAFDKKIKTKHKKLKTELYVQPGFVVDEIIRFTQTHKIELIVMGVTGAGKSPGLLGSNTTAVMQRAQTPVIVVPKKYKFKSPEVIALACNYKANLPDETVEKFKSFLRLFNSRLMVLNVLKTNELATYEKAATEVNLENSLSDIEHTLHFSASDDLPDEINRFIDKHRAGMLVMFPRQYNFFKGLVHHSATKEMAFLSHVPLLSIHE